MHLIQWWISMIQWILIKTSAYNNIWNRGFLYSFSYDQNIWSKYMKIYIFFILDFMKTSTPQKSRKPKNKI